MAVLFALANRRAGTTVRLNVFGLLGEAFRLDQKILLAFLVALFLVWALSLLDLWVLQKKKEGLR